MKFTFNPHPNAAEELYELRQKVQNGEPVNQEYVYELYLYNLLNEGTQLSDDQMKDVRRFQAKHERLKQNAQAEAPMTQEEEVVQELVEEEMSLESSRNDGSEIIIEDDEFSEEEFSEAFDEESLIEEEYHEEEIIEEEHSVASNGFDDSGLILGSEEDLDDDLEFILEIDDGENSDAIIRVEEPTDDEFVLASDDGEDNQEEESWIEEEQTIEEDEEEEEVMHEKTEEHTPAHNMNVDEENHVETTASEKEDPNDDAGFKELHGLLHRQTKAELSTTEKERLYELQLYDRLRKGEELDEKQIKDLLVLKKRRQLTKRYNKEYLELAKRKQNTQIVDERRLYCLGLAYREFHGERLTQDERHTLDTFEEKETRRRKEKLIGDGDVERTPMGRDVAISVKSSQNNAVEALSNADPTDDPKDLTNSTPPEYDRIPDAGDQLKILKGKAQNGETVDEKRVYELYLNHMLNQGKELSPDQVRDLKNIQKPKKRQKQLKDTENFNNESSSSHESDHLENNESYQEEKNKDDESEDLYEAEEEERRAMQQALKAKREAQAMAEEKKSFRLSLVSQIKPEPSSSSSSKSSTAQNAVKHVHIAKPDTPDSYSSKATSALDSAQDAFSENQETKLDASQRTPNKAKPLGKDLKIRSHGDSFLTRHSESFEEDARDPAMPENASDPKDTSSPGYDRILNAGAQLKKLRKKIQNGHEVDEKSVYELYLHHMLNEGKELSPEQETDLVELAKKRRQKQSSETEEKTNEPTPREEISNRESEESFHVGTPAFKAQANEERKTNESSHISADDSSDLKPSSSPERIVQKGAEPEKTNTAASTVATSTAANTNNSSAFSDNQEATFDATPKSPNKAKPWEEDLKIRSPGDSFLTRHSESFEEDASGLALPEFSFDPKDTTGSSPGYNRILTAGAQLKILRRKIQNGHEVDEKRLYELYLHHMLNEGKELSPEQETDLVELAKKRRQKQSSEIEAKINETPQSHLEKAISSDPQGLEAQEPLSTTTTNEYDKVAEESSEEESSSESSSSVSYEPDEEDSGIDEPSKILHEESTNTSGQPPAPSDLNELRRSLTEALPNFDKELIDLQNQMEKGETIDNNRAYDLYLFDLLQRDKQLTDDQIEDLNDLLSKEQEAEKRTNITDAEPADISPAPGGGKLKRSSSSERFREEYQDLLRQKEKGETVDEYRLKLLEVSQRKRNTSQDKESKKYSQRHSQTIFEVSTDQVESIMKNLQGGFERQSMRIENTNDGNMYESQLIDKLKHGEELSEKQIQDLVLFKTRRQIERHYEYEFQKLSNRKKNGKQIDGHLYYMLELFNRNKNGETLSAAQLNRLKNFESTETHVIQQEFSNRNLADIMKIVNAARDNSASKNEESPNLSILSSTGWSSNEENSSSESSEDTEELAIVPLSISSISSNESEEEMEDHTKQTVEKLKEEKTPKRFAALAQDHDSDSDVSSESLGRKEKILETAVVPTLDHISRNAPPQKTEELNKPQLIREPSSSGSDQSSVSSVETEQLIKNSTKPEEQIRLEEATRENTAPAQDVDDPNASSDDSEDLYNAEEAARRAKQQALKAKLEAESMAAEEERARLSLENQRKAKLESEDQKQTKSEPETLKIAGTIVTEDKSEAEARAMLVAKAKRRNEAKEKARIEAEEKARRVVEEKLFDEAKENAKREATERARIYEGKKVQLEMEKKAQQDTSAKAREEMFAAVRAREQRGSPTPEPFKRSQLKPQTAQTYNRQDKPMLTLQDELKQAAKARVQKAANTPEPVQGNKSAAQTEPIDTRQDKHHVPTLQDELKAKLGKRVVKQSNKSIEAKIGTRQDKQPAPTLQDELKAKLEKQAAKQSNESIEAQIKQHRKPQTTAQRFSSKPEIGVNRSVDAQPKPSWQAKLKEKLKAQAAAGDRHSLGVYTPRQSNQKPVGPPVRYEANGTSLSSTVKSKPKTPDVSLYAKQVQTIGSSESTMKSKPKPPGFGLLTSLGQGIGSSEINYRVKSPRPSKQAEQRISWTSGPVSSYSDWRVEVSSTPQRPGDEIEIYFLHRNILGFGPRKSGYFRKEFQKQRKEASTGVDVPCASHLKLRRTQAELFPMVLDFLYNIREAKHAMTAEKASAVFRLATNMKIPGLQKVLIDFFETNLSRTNIEKFLTCAKRHSADPLVLVCNNWMERLVNPDFVSPTLVEMEPDQNTISWNSNPLSSFSDWRVEIYIKGEEHNVQLYNIHRNIVGFGSRKSFFFVSEFERQRNMELAGHDAPCISRLKLRPSQAKSFPMILDYIYKTKGGKRAFTADEAASVFKLASHLQVPGLKKIIIGFYEKNLSVKSIEKFMSHATRDGADELVEVCNKWMERMVVQ